MKKYVSVARLHSIAKITHESGTIGRMTRLTRVTDHSDWLTPRSSVLFSSRLLFLLARPSAVALLCYPAVPLELRRNPLPLGLPRNPISAIDTDPTCVRSYRSTSNHLSTTADKN